MPINYLKKIRALPAEATIPLAVFLLVVVWLFVFPESRDWALARYVHNNTTGYSNFLAKYPQSIHREDALYHRVLEEITVQHARAYLQAADAGTIEGCYKKEVLALLRLREASDLYLMANSPTVEQVQDFLDNYPDSRRFPDLIAPVTAGSSELRALMPAIERAYVNSLYLYPTVSDFSAFLDQFPATAHFAELRRMLHQHPEIAPWVLPKLEIAGLNRIWAISSTDQVRAYLDVFPEAAYTHKQEILNAVGQTPPVWREVLAEIEKTRRCTPEPVVFRSDADSDGIPDIQDACPDKPGRISEKGCPPPLEGVPVKEPDMIFVKGGDVILGQEDHIGIVLLSGYKTRIGDYYIGQYEVTVAELVSYLNHSPETEHDLDSYFEKYNHVYRQGRYYGVWPGFESFPVRGISLNTAVNFCIWLSAVTGKHYRIPSEAEWEYAARGGSQTKHYRYSGSNELDKVGWYLSNSKDDVHPVGGLAGNELGIKDMSGNVAEWCIDQYIPHFFSVNGFQPVISRESEAKAIRGGCYLQPSAAHGNTTRSFEFSRPSFAVGFRVVRDVFPPSGKHHKQRAGQR